MVVLYHRLIKNAIGLDNNFFIHRVFPHWTAGHSIHNICSAKKASRVSQVVSTAIRYTAFLLSAVFYTTSIRMRPHSESRHALLRKPRGGQRARVLLRPRKREDIPFRAQLDLPESLPVDEIDMCLVLSNLLENALEASLRTVPDRRLRVTAYLHAERLLLIEVENAFDGEVMEKGGVFRSSKRKGNGVGIRSVRHIAEKTGGASTFTYQSGVFSARVMLGG